MNLPSPWYPSLPMLLHPRRLLWRLACILSSGPHKLPWIRFGDISSGLTPTAVSPPSSPGDLVSFGEPVSRWNVKVISGQWHLLRLSEEPGNKGGESACTYFREA